MTVITSPERDTERRVNKGVDLCVSSEKINMVQFFTLVIYLPIYLAATQHYRRALYPSAYRIKRGTHSLINPTFQRSADDINLLFEMLLSGMQIQGEDQGMLIPDEELASLRVVAKLEVICEDVLPKKLSDIRRLIAELAQRQRPLSWEDFERTVLTLVYTSQTLTQISNKQQREAWSHTLIQLFRAVQKDLRPTRK